MPGRDSRRSRDCRNLARSSNSFGGFRELLRGMTAELKFCLPKGKSRTRPPGRIQCRSTTRTATSNPGLGTAGLANGAAGGLWIVRQVKSIGPAPPPRLKSAGMPMKSSQAAEIVISLPCSQPMQDGRRDGARLQRAGKGAIRPSGTCTQWHQQFKSRDLDFPC